MAIQVHAKRESGSPQVSVLLGDFFQGALFFVDELPHFSGLPPKLFLKKAKCEQPLRLSAIITNIVISLFMRIVIFDTNAQTSFAIPCLLFLRCAIYRCTSLCENGSFVTTATYPICRCAAQPENEFVEKK